MLSRFLCAMQTFTIEVSLGMTVTLVVNLLIIVIVTWKDYQKYLHYYLITLCLKNKMFYIKAHLYYKKRINFKITFIV